MFFLPQLALAYHVPDIPAFTISFPLIWINFLYKYCHYNPDIQIKLYLTSLTLSMKYYPYLLCAIFMTVNLPEVRLDGLFGLLLGVI